MSCTIIAVINQKGGSGKTTTVANLASALARAGKKILMCDIDDQGSLTESFGMIPDDPEFNGMTIGKLFNAKTDPAECCYLVENVTPIIGEDKLFIVPSGQELSEIQDKLYFNPELMKTFRDQLNRLRPYFDVIYIDTPPSLSKWLTTAVFCCDEAIICVNPETLSVSGLKRAISSIDGIKNAPPNKMGNPNVELMGVVVTRFNKDQSEHRILLEDIEKKYNVLGVIPQSSFATKDIPSKGLPVVLSRTYSNPAKAYSEIAEKVLELTSEKE